MIVAMFTEEESGSERGRSCQGHKVASAGLWGTQLHREQDEQCLQKKWVNSGHIAIYGILMTVIPCPFYVGVVMMPEHSLLCVLPKW